MAYYVLRHYDISQIEFTLKYFIFKMNLILSAATSTCLVEKLDGRVA